MPAAWGSGRGDNDVLPLGGDRHVGACGQRDIVFKRIETGNHTNYCPQLAEVPAKTAYGEAVNA